MMILPLLLVAMLPTLSPPTTNVFDNRAQDWRLGAVIYQVFTDRFAPSSDLAAKKRFYSPPRVLRDWSETPHASEYDPKIGYPHVFEFWGGDLKSIEGKLDYVEDLGADVLYLTPIFQAPSNHKYDTEDYTKIAPEFGTQQDLLNLIQDVHKRKMRIMLDGVFNHIGSTSPQFQQAQKDPNSPYRRWFTFDAKYPNGYRAYYGVKDMPELHLESPVVANYFWRTKNSIVQRYLRAGIDGWRLDVAYNIGPEILTQITRMAHETKPGSAVVGEISGYPANWFPAVDGVFNFHSMNIAIDMLNGQISGGRAGRMLERVVSDAGLENILRSWLQIDNHDTPRAANILPDPEIRRVAEALLLSLPGSPVIYYGSEIGMTGKGDPEDRAPMRWDTVAENPPELQWVRRLIHLRKDHPALRYGDFNVLDTDKLLAFTRSTDKLRETVLVVVNPTGETVKETFATRIGRLISWGEMEDVFSRTKVQSITGMITAEMPPHSVMFFVPASASHDNYDPAERIP
jgi:glycosidase